MSEWSCPKCARVVALADRPRMSDGRLFKHCGCARAYVRVEGGALTIQDRRREWKRRLRRKQGKTKRRHDAHVDAYEAHCAAVKRCALGSLHDAHVRLFRTPAVQWHVKDKHRPRVRERRIERRREQRESLSDQYIGRVIREKSLLHKDEIPQELIEAQRAVLKLKRATKEARNEDDH